MHANKRFSLVALRCLTSVALSLTLMPALSSPEMLDQSEQRSAVEMIPLHLSLPSVMVFGESVKIGVTVESVPPDGGSVQILCITPGVLVSPGGSWPCQVVYAGGASATADVTVSANPVLLPTIVTMYMAAADANPNNISEWTYAGTILVLP